MVLEGLKPERVFYYFEQICNIPHGSYNTKKISDYVVTFAKEHNLKYLQDELNNVIIFKDAVGGLEYESAPPLIIQGHMDMVCEKNADVDHDFMNDPLDIFVEDGFVKARGTTLGGDDGIAVAYALALLEDSKIKGPSLEIVLTTEEETGMEVANGLDVSTLKGKHMLNLDSEDEGVFTISCAGGVTFTTIIPANTVPCRGRVVDIEIKGLKGGHSGVDINEGRINSIKLLGELLMKLGSKFETRILSIKGGIKHNAIPREARAMVVIKDSELEAFLEELSSLGNEYVNNLKITEPDINIYFEINQSYNDIKALNIEDSNRVIEFLYRIPNGVIGYSEDIKNFPETSLNTGILSMENDIISITSLLRSSKASALEDLKQNLIDICKDLDFSYNIDGSYPGWEYTPDSSLRRLMIDQYINGFVKQPVLEAIHAGLECGILASKIDGLDIVSTGPDILDIHTPKERLSIESVERTWRFILLILDKYPEYIK